MLIPVLLLNMSVSPLLKVAQKCHSASKFPEAACNRVISTHVKWILLLKADTFCKVSYYGQILTKPTMTIHINSGQFTTFDWSGTISQPLRKLFSIKIPYYPTIVALVCSRLVYTCWFTTDFRRLSYRFAGSVVFIMCIGLYFTRLKSVYDSFINNVWTIKRRTGSHP